MGLANDMREKAGQLHALATALTQHLEEPDEEKWLQGGLPETVQHLRQALSEVESGLDLDPPAADSEESPGFFVTTREKLEASRAQVRSRADEKKAELGKSVSLAKASLHDDSTADASTPDGATRGPQAAALAAAPLGGGGPGGGGPGGSSRGDGDDDGPNATSLEDFFSQVGGSLVSAQRQLDQRSQEYIAELAATGAGRDMATLYRIPKVTAELKFALEKVDTQGINLLIHKQGTEASTLNEQSVQFEIAAVPAPAETLDAIQRLAPRVELLLDPSHRQKIFEAIEALESPLATAAEKAVLESSQELLLSQQRQILIVAAGEGSYFLAFADQEEEHHLGVWHFELESSTLTSVYRFDLKPKSQEEPLVLRNWVAALSARQATFLGSL